MPTIRASRWAHYRPAVLGGARGRRPVISYAGSPFTWPEDSAISTASPTSTGGTITSYAVVAGTLPNGISLNTSTGDLTGTPTDAQAAANVTIRATGPGGSYDVVISITVTAVSSLLTGLVAYWTLDEASGTREDSTANNLDLTDNNTVTQQGGKVGSAAQFTAANTEFLSRANEAVIDLGDTTFYMAGWVFRDAAGAYHMLFTKHDGAGILFELRVDDTNVLTFTVWDGVTTTRGTKSSAGAINATTWIFVEAYHNHVANEIGVAVSGGAWETAATSGALGASAAPICLGARAAGGVPHNGRLDEWGLWSRIPDAGERALLAAGVTYPAFA